MVEMQLTCVGSPDATIRRVIREEVRREGKECCSRIRHPDERSLRQVLPCACASYPRLLQPGRFRLSQPPPAFRKTRAYEPQVAQACAQ